jgi:hypothetical protein
MIQQLSIHILYLHRCLTTPHLSGEAFEGGTVGLVLTPVLLGRLRQGGKIKRTLVLGVLFVKQAEDCGQVWDMWGVYTHREN